MERTEDTEFTGASAQPKYFPVMTDLNAGRQVEAVLPQSQTLRAFTASSQIKTRSQTGKASRLKEPGWSPKLYLSVVDDCFVIFRPAGTFENSTGTTRVSTLVPVRPNEITQMSIASTSRRP